MSKKPSAGGKIQWTKMFRKLSPYTIRKGFRYMKHYGPKEFWIRLHERFEPEEVPYGPWYRAYIPDYLMLSRPAGTLSGGTYKKCISFQKHNFYCSSYVYSPDCHSLLVLWNRAWLFPSRNRM